MPKAPKLSIRQRKEHEAEKWNDKAWFKTHRINVSSIDGIFAKKLRYGVNWGAYGTVAPKEAKKFARELAKATKFAEKLNREKK